MNFLSEKQETTIGGTGIKISREIDSSARLSGKEKAIAHLAKACFDAWVFSMFSMCDYNWDSERILETGHPLAGSGYLKFARKLKQVSTFSEDTIFVGMKALYHAVEKLVQMFEM